MTILAPQLRHVVRWVDTARRGVLALVLAASLASCAPSDGPGPGPEQLWQVQPQADGTLDVLGITLGTSTLLELRETLGKPAAIGLFTRGDEPVSLEAYFGEVRLGGLSAKIVAVAAAGPRILAELHGRSIKPGKAMPSGARRHDLTDADLRMVQSLPVAGLTVVPVAAMDRALVERLFGAPQTRATIDEEREYLLYPERGTAVLVNARGREMIHYVAPRAFASLRSRITDGDLDALGVSGPG